MSADRKNKLIFAIWALAVVLADIGAYVAVIAARLALNDFKTPPHTLQAKCVLAAAFAASGLLTAFFIWRQRSAIKRGGRYVLIVIGLMAMVLFAFGLAGRPVGSVDNYWNTLMARGWALQGRNPYLTVPLDLNGDPVFKLTAREWEKTPMMYGPLWNLAAAAPAWLLRSPDAAIFGMKALVGLAYFGAGLLLAAWLRRRGNPNANVFLAAWLLNPAGIFEAVNAGHNEGFLLLPLAVAVIGLKDKRPGLALPGISAAALVKIWPLALLPALAGLRRAGRRGWLVGLAWSAALAGSYAFFWDGPRMLATLADRIGILSVPLFSPGYALIWRAFDWVGHARGLDAVTASANQTAIALLLATAIAVGWLSLKGRVSPLAAAAAMMAVFMFVAVNWLEPWYLLAFWPLLVPAPDEAGLKRLIVSSAALTTAGFAAYATTWPYIAAAAAALAVGWLVYKDADERAARKRP